MISLKNAARFVASIIQHPGASTKSFSVHFQSRKGSFQEGGKYFGIIQKLLYVSPKAAKKMSVWGKRSRDLSRGRMCHPQGTRKPKALGKNHPDFQVLWAEKDHRRKWTHTIAFCWEKKWIFKPSILLPAFLITNLSAHNWLFHYFF